MFMEYCFLQTLQAFVDAAPRHPGHSGIWVRQAFEAGFLDPTLLMPAPHFLMMSRLDPHVGSTAMPASGAEPEVGLMHCGGDRFDEIIERQIRDSPNGLNGDSHHVAVSLMGDVLCGTIQRLTMLPWDLECRKIANRLLTEALYESGPQRGFRSTLCGLICKHLGSEAPVALPQKHLDLLAAEQPIEAAFLQATNTMHPLERCLLFCVVYLGCNSADLQSAASLLPERFPDSWRAEEWLLRVWTDIFERM